MNFEVWEQNIREEIRSDPLWNLMIYRQAMFLCEIGWYDATKLTKDPRTIQLSDMLYRSLGAISAYLAEGYSRGSGRNRVQFYESALGAARASRDWYFKGRHVLGERVADHRIKTLSGFIEALQGVIDGYRGKSTAEAQAKYSADSNSPGASQPDDLENVALPGFTTDVPLPQGVGGRQADSKFLKDFRGE